MKIVKRMIILTILIILCVKCNSNASFLYQLDPDENAEYKERQIDVMGLKAVFGDKMLYSAENNKTTLEEKNNNNLIIAMFSGAMVIYWIILLCIYEREDTYNYHKDRDDFEILTKYNPLIAGCLVDNREVLPRDVTAIILNLIKKGVINMKMVPNNKGKENYTYMISENKGDRENIDEIEAYVLGMVFNFYEEEEVDLIKKLKELSKKKEFSKQMKELNKMAQNKLNNEGANLNKVPVFIRVMNFFLIAISIVLTVVHIMNNGLNIHVYETTIFIALFLIIAIIVAIPLIAFIIHLILFTITLSNKLIKILTEKYSGKKIVTMTFLILVPLLAIIALLYFVIPSKYLCLDVFMIGMSILIVRTDNLMTKHSKEILNDYYSLQEVKYRIEEYSLIKDEQINYIKIWEEYLIYAVAFGIPVPIVNKLKGTYKEDEDLRYLLKCENLYYICKAYLEVMWEMKFKERKNVFKIKDLF